MNFHLIIPRRINSQPIKEKILLILFENYWKGWIVKRNSQFID